NQAKADGIKAIDDQHKSGDGFIEVPKYQKTGNTVPVQTKALPYVEDKKTSMSYSNSLPKTGEAKTIKLLLLGVIGVLGSLISFVVLKKKS
ncbi:LPXTG cell wall anchor domain-containing protein, partial [Enterococcus faecalis]